MRFMIYDSYRARKEQNEILHPRDPLKRKLHLGKSFHFIITQVPFPSLLTRFGQSYQKFTVFQISIRCFDSSFQREIVTRSPRIINFSACSSSSLYRTKRDLKSTLNRRFIYSFPLPTPTVLFDFIAYI